MATLRSHPKERREQAMQLIEAWFNEEIEYDDLFERLEQLAEGMEKASPYQHA